MPVDKMWWQTYRKHMNISETLRAAIAADGRTYLALSAASGVDVAQISRFARELRTLTLPAVDKLAAELNLVLMERPETPRHATRTPREGVDMGRTRRTQQAPRRKAGRYEKGA
ncbi:MAG: helix-turn-helix transcriptional regulator [Phycisphaerales bacterium]|nr:helix-turn-helix transcriptional regulator [Phycisphaerales bacterium]